MGADTLPLFGSGLRRPLADAWDELPGPWRSLCGDISRHEAAICRRVDADAGAYAVAPERPFRAFELVAPDEVRLVLIGQDPYPREGDANGLAFASDRGIPHSMRQVYKALEMAVPGFRRPPTADLAPWARQGVLLLNTALTVRVGPKMAGSHLDLGWQAWTGGLLRALYVARRDAGGRLPVAWLWGGKAAEFFDAWTAGLDVPAECVLRARHPSNDFKGEFLAQACEQLGRLQGLLDPPIRW